MCGKDVTVTHWTFSEIRTLRAARRMSVREFVEHLGVSPRIVSRWEADDIASYPRPVNEAALDTSLRKADEAARCRFALMIKHDEGGFMVTDNEQLWRGAWDVGGTRSDDHGAARIRIGVIEMDDTESIAISVGEQSPVAISHDAATEIAELCEWAIQEHELLADIRQRRQTHGNKEELDRAILTHRQWERIRRILKSDEIIDTYAATKALRQLHNAAPASWLGSERGTAR